MRTSSSIHFLIGIVVTLVSACAPATPAGLSDTDRAAIRHAEDEWVRLTTAKDWPAAVKTYWTDDAVALPPNAPAASGQKGITEWIAAFPPFSDFTLQDVTVDGRGDLAYVHGRYSFMMLLPGAATPTRDEGKHITVFKKQADGTWKASVATFSSDLPLPAPAPAKK